MDDHTGHAAFHKHRRPDYLFVILDGFNARPADKKAGHDCAFFA